MLNNLLINKVNYIIVTLFSFFWSLTFFFNPNGDYGTYLALSYLINEGQILYTDLFDHKGPFFYFFLSSINELIGNGFYQSYAILILISLIYLYPLIYLLNKKTNSLYLKITVLLLIISSFYKQDGNSSIALFQSGLIIIFFIFLTKCLEDKNKFKINWLISTIFISLAILTRIDSFIFFPLLFIIFFFKYNNINLKKIIFDILLSLITFLIVFLFLLILLSYSLNFELSNFLNNNFYFNFWYSGNFTNKFFYRPNQYSILLITGILIAIIFILHNILKKYAYKNLKNSLFKFLKFKDAEIKIELLYFDLFFLFLGFSSLIISIHDVFYYLYMFYAPALYFICSRLNLISPKFFKYLIVLSVYSIILNASPIIVKLIKNKNCLKTSFNYECKNINSTIADPDFKNSPIVLGDNGWVLLFSQSVPSNVFTNWWFYFDNKSYENETFLASHKKIINMPSNTKIWIQHSLLNSNNLNNKYLNEILDITYFVKNQGNYITYIIK